MFMFIVVNVVITCENHMQYERVNRSRRHEGARRLIIINENFATPFSLDNHKTVKCY